MTSAFPLYYSCVRIVCPIEGLLAKMLIIIIIITIMLLLLRKKVRNLLQTCFVKVCTVDFLYLMLISVHCLVQVQVASYE